MPDYRAYMASTHSRSTAKGIATISGGDDLAREDLENRAQGGVRETVMKKNFCRCGNKRWKNKVYEMSTE